MVVCTALQAEHTYPESLACTRQLYAVIEFVDGGLTCYSYKHTGLLCGAPHTDSIGHRVPPDLQ